MGMIRRLAAIVLGMMLIIACDGEEQAEQDANQAATPPVEIRSAPRTPDDPPVRWSAVEVGRFPGDVGGGPLVKQQPVLTLPSWWPSSGVDSSDGQIRPNDQSPRYRMVGRSEDGTWIAVRAVTGDEGLIWLKSEGVTTVEVVAGLPVLANAPQAGPEPVMASHDWFSIGIRAWPGHENGFRIVRRWGEAPTKYPVVGRSLNGGYIAVRLGQVNPPVVWVERGSVGIGSDAPEAPVLVASGTEAIGPDGEFAAIQRMSRWQWRADSTIVGANNNGVWHWDPDSGVLRRITEASFKPVFSSDGSYVAIGQPQYAEDGMIAWERPRVVQVWPVDEEGEPLTFEGVNRFYFTHHPTDPSLRWSPDSRYLLSYLDVRGDEPSGRWFVLDIQGGQSELPPIGRAWPVWLADSTLAFLASDDMLLRISPTGELLQELELDLGAVQYIRWSPTETTALAGGDEGWFRIDLDAARIAALPMSLDEGDWRAQWSSDGGFALFASAAGALVLYSTEANSAERIGAVKLPAGRSPSLRALWDSGSERFAVVGADGALYIVERESSEATVVRSGSDGLFGGMVPLAWSPDGEQLLTRVVRAVDRVDQDGYAAFPQTSFGPVVWLYAEFLVLDRSGAMQESYRAYTNGCGEYVRGEWSPNGRWLVFAGDVWDCN